MFPTSKMVQSGYRVIQYLLLCLLWQLGPTGTGWTEYSSLGIYQTASISGEDTGKIVLFIVNAVLNKLGKKLDKGYRCPVYCDIDHKHIYWENYETEKSNISTDDELSRPDEYELREQQESSLRPIASTN